MGTTAWRQEDLLNTHFPNCVDPHNYPLGVAKAGMVPTWRRSLLGQGKLTISSFKHFKSPGSDGIFSALIQHSTDILYEYDRPPGLLLR